METRERKYPSGIPMNEEELKEWRKAFSDIQESIDNLSEEDGSIKRNPEQHSRQIRKEGC